MLTTIDDNAGLEVYINVPVQQAPQLKLGLPVRIVDDRATCWRPRRSRSSRRRSTTTTQTVLVKARDRGDGRPVPHGSVRARAHRLVDDAGLTVPVVAVNRINGQFFVFVAEPGQKARPGRAAAVRSRSGR